MHLRRELGLLRTRRLHRAETILGVVATLRRGVAGLLGLLTYRLQIALGRFEFVEHVGVVSGPKLEQRLALHGLTRRARFETREEIVGRRLDVGLDCELRNLGAQSIDLLLLRRFRLPRFIGVAFGVARGPLRVAVGRLLAAHVVVERLQCLVDFGVRRLQRIHLRRGRSFLTSELFAVGPRIIAATRGRNYANEYCRQREERGEEGHQTRRGALRVGRRRGPQPEGNIRNTTAT